MLVVNYRFTSVRYIAIVLVVVSCFLVKSVSSAAVCDLLHAFGSPEALLNGGWECVSGVPVGNKCSGWLGVKCTSSNEISEIKLNDLQLSGTMTTSLGQLLSLTYLDLSSNSISGTFPDISADLFRLVLLDLSNNRMTGQIPPEAGRFNGLKRLSLNGNQFSGRLPFELGDLAQLTGMFLQNNQIVGPIPPGFSNLEFLQTLYIGNNFITSAIPNQISSLRYLKDFNAEGNNLGSEIPTAICELPSLETLNLRRNFFSNTIPACMSKLVNLNNLLLFQNELSFAIDDSITDMTQLEYLDIGYNYISGVIPSSISKMTNLKIFDIHSNYMTGFIPLELAQVFSLETIEFQNNQFNGEIPANIGAIANLKDIHIQDNLIGGTIPDSLGYLINLESINFESLKLTGPLPSTFGQLSSLTSLNLRRTLITGSLPETIGDFSNLAVLTIHGSSFSKSLPSSMSKLSSLVSFTAHLNQFTGQLPDLSASSGLTELILNNNHFIGSIPQQFGSSQTVLATVQLEYNSLTGTIPTAMGGLTAMTSLTMQNNFLSGDINPLSALVSVQILDLSHNNLTGMIPSNFPMMTSLVTLDLSSNQLSGVLHSNIGLLESLRTFKLDHNNIVGTIPNEIKNMVSLQFLYFSSNGFYGIVPSGLCEIKSLFRVNVQGNDISCYDSCFDTKPSMFFIKDDGLKVCNGLVDDLLIAPSIVEDYATCSYPQNSNLPSTWSLRDYCSFFQETHCTASAIYYYSASVPDGKGGFYVCPPSCLAQAPSSYCQSFALLALGCGADEGYTMSDVTALTDNCLTAYESSQPFLGIVTTKVRFTLTDINSANLISRRLSVRELSAEANTAQQQALVNAFAIAAGFSISKVTFLNLGVQGENGLTNGIFTLEVTASIQSLGYTLNQADSALSLLQRKCILALNETILMSSGGSLASAVVVQLLTLYDNNPDSWVYNTTRNGVPEFFDSVTEFARTALPTQVPTSSPSTPKPIKSVEPTSSPTVSPTATARCLSFELVDLFGDGWDSAKLSVISSTEGQVDLFPTCKANPLYTQYCFYEEGNDDGDYVVIAMTGYDPQRPWEIFWRVTDVFAGITYTGDYDTALTFTYYEKTSMTNETSKNWEDPVIRNMTRSLPAEEADRRPMWGETFIALTKSDNVVKESDECERCKVWNMPSTEEAPKKKPHHHHHKKKPGPRSSAPKASPTLPPTSKFSSSNGGYNSYGFGLVSPKYSPSSKSSPSFPFGISNPTYNMYTAPSADTRSGSVTDIAAGDAEDTTHNGSGAHYPPQTDESNVPDAYQESGSTSNGGATYEETAQYEYNSARNFQYLTNQNDYAPQDARANTGYASYPNAYEYVETQQREAQNPYQFQSHNGFSLLSATSPAKTASSNAGMNTAGNTLNSGMTTAINTKFNGVGTEVIHAHRALGEYSLDYSLCGYDGSWSSPNGLGAKFYVTYDDDVLFYSGQLCNEKSEKIWNATRIDDDDKSSKSKGYTCATQIPDGEYTWRVTGGFAMNKDSIEWEFCGVSGSTSAELEFTVKNGKCTPLGLTYVSLTCEVSGRSNNLASDEVDFGTGALEGEGDVAGVDGEGESEEIAGVHVHGVLQLEGIADDLVGKESDLLKHAITQEFNDARLGSEELKDQATIVTILDSIETRRLLEKQNTVAKEVHFKVHMRVPHFEPNVLKSYLDKSMSSGLFVTRVKALTHKSLSNTGLQRISSASLLDLRVIHETLENEPFSVLATAVVVVCGFAGFVFATLLMMSYRRSFEGYSKVQLSDRDIDNKESEVNQRQLKKTIELTSSV
mmetsp:Transcript_15755/g.15904  ORF Transcript_15755/g.15904 Transcript_15755/m.15904 type:complete len:1792 (-) Transcript_15755:114-5489(-)